MRSTPSIIPQSADRDVYLVLDNFGALGRAWRETDEERADRKTVITDLMDGQYKEPVRIVAFITAEGVARRVGRAGRRNRPAMCGGRFRRASIPSGFRRSARQRPSDAAAASSAARRLTMASPRYFAYHVDLQGVALASYKLKATEDAAAVSEARHLLKLHPSLEIWRAARFVARLEAETSTKSSAALAQEKW